MTKEKNIKDSKGEKTENIYPQSHKITAVCDCGAKVEVLSVNEEMKVEICSQCHPFYTGQSKTVDTAGRVDKFKKRFAAAKK